MIYSSTSRWHIFKSGEIPLVLKKACENLLEQVYFHAETAKVT